jgi:signal transduction histidine kinase/CheY-like chemotaxis protein
LGDWIDALVDVNAAAALLLAGVAGLRAWRGGHADRWGAAAFAALAFVLAVLEVEERADWVTKAVLCCLVAFPYLLLRFAASFRALPPVLARVALWMTAAMLVVTVALPAFPEDDNARPGWIVAYLLGLFAFWSATSVVTILMLWRGGQGQPTLVRRRARLMSAAIGGMNALILLAAIGFTEGQGVIQALLLVCLGSFAVGFAPPHIVRLAWREHERGELHRATERLMGATTVPEVTDTLLPHVARTVGGTGAALLDLDGSIVASFGSIPDVEGHDVSNGDHGHIEVVPLSPPFGSLVVATGPLTPFFGRDEVGLLHALGALADLSLARCALTERERDNQAAVHDAMKEAERANTAKSDFLSRMSHELRTPLNVVLGFGQILEMKDTLDGRDREAVEHILKAGRHLLELINEVLDLATIESGRMTISPEPVELAELVGETLDLIRPLALDRSIRVTSDLELCHSHVIADRQRLKQVLLNLYSNAIKYNHDGGEVAVSCSESAAGKLRLHVRDTGPGIPATLRARLFEPFERLGAEQHVEGTGLGLALSRQLVELMGGEIGVESREGEGSVFWIDLATADAPLDSDAGTARVKHGVQHAGPASERRRLLLIEDNLANLKVIESVMSRRPHIELLPAMTGRLGLELAREHAPDLILLDQHLPDVSGVEMLHRVKADPGLQDIPVVVVSADATPGQISRMLEIGAADYLTKPLDIAKFLEIIDRLVDGRGGSS